MNLFYEYDKVLYYECHVTTEPVFGARRDQLEAIANSLGFKLATLLMQRTLFGKSEPSAKDAFMTARVDADDDVDLVVRMHLLLKALAEAKFQVYRYKIEAAMLDVRLPREAPHE